MKADDQLDIVITQSSDVTVLADGRICQTPFVSRWLVGRTGRGDACFAAYLGKRKTVPPEVATSWAAALTTLKQEKPGPWLSTLDELHELVQRSKGGSATGT